MNTTNITDLSVVYSGCVEVHYVDKINNKLKVIKQKNNGAIGLFTAVTRFLAGESAVDFMPSYIKGYYKTSDGNYPAFTQNIPYTIKPRLSCDESYADGTLSNMIEYTFLVPYMCLAQTTNPITDLELYNNKDIVCAKISLTSDKAIDTNISSNILIYWKLKFGNAPEAKA